MWITKWKLLNIIKDQLVTEFGTNLDGFSAEDRYATGDIRRTRKLTAIITSAVRYAGNYHRPRTHYDLAEDALR